MSTSAALADVLGKGPVLLDGGLSTELEAQGHDVSGDLWSAVLLRDDPQAIVAAHAAFFAAGARVATSAGYQASDEGFGAAGIETATGHELMRRSITLAQQARDQAGLRAPSQARTASDGDPHRDRDAAWVAASVGPYGAVLAGGQEYTGQYPAGRDTVAGLRAFHRPRLEVFASAGPDLLACETIPSLVEVEALLRELDDLGLPAWLSLTTVTTPDGRVLTRRGEDAREAFAMAADVDAVIAVGVNCTDPLTLTPAIQVAAASGKPVVAYPNSGEIWDGAARAWRGTPGLDDTAVTQWLDAGARLVGGCCRVTPVDIARTATVLATGRG